MANDRISLKINDLNEALSDYQVQSLEQVVLEGDIKMDLSGGSPRGLARPLGQEFARIALQLFDLSRAMGYPVDCMLQTEKNSGGSASK